MVFAHPALERSRVHRRLLSAVAEVTGVTVRDLYEEYPDFYVDVAREQELLEAHDLVVLQHPFFWYSIPPLLKQWIDLVLEHGWAYGSEGDALAGKQVLSVISTGGGEEAYRRGGYNRFTMRQFLAPVEQTFVLCGMTYLPPFVVHGAHGMTVEQIEAHARAYRRAIEWLRDERLDLEELMASPRLDLVLGDRDGGPAGEG